MEKKIEKKKVRLKEPLTKAENKNKKHIKNTDKPKSSETTSAKHKQWNPADLYF